MKKPVISFYTKLLVPYLLAILLPYAGHTQIGDVLWEEHFNSLNTEIWNPIEGNGCPNLCGWGNAELENYQSDNLSIQDIPGEIGNKALVLEARRETLGTSSFTSGKVDTEGNLSVHYGLIEVRMQVPDLQTGLWPAAWLLGTSSLTWPAKGEIDMMEMGHQQHERTNQGFPSSTTNNFVGANAIFQTTDGQYASIAYDVNYNQPYVAPTPLSGRFVTYRLYWEPTSMRFTVIDGGVEHDLYTNPLPIEANGNTAAFTKPFYLLLNLAVGGNFTDATSAAQVTAPLPAKMYVDYVRVSEWNGFGEVALNYGDIQPESGVFGLFTETTPTNNEVVYGADADIYVWGGTMQDGNIAPYEGSSVIAWETTTANSWFGGGITALYGRNMSNYSENGSLKFKIKIPADVDFKIGITDNYTNEKYLDFPANQTTYGLVRNGEWGQVEIPLADFAGLLAFQNLNYLFAITSNDGNLPSSTFQFAIDDLIWDDGNGNTIALTSVVVSPSSVTISEGETQSFAAQAYDQNGNPMNASFTWTATGGNISSSGLFTGSENGDFIVTASSNGINGTANVVVQPTASSAGCTQSAPNGDYVVEISDDSDNPTFTFVPSATGIGNPTAILYYSTNPDVTFPGYQITPNVEQSIVASNGQTVYFYYTYSVPEGGERTSLHDSHSFVVGSCNNNSRMAAGNNDNLLSLEKDFKIVPNPASAEIHLNIPAGYEEAEIFILDVMGHSYEHVSTKGSSQTIKIDNLPNGTYFLQITKGEQSTLIKRFIKK